MTLSAQTYKPTLMQKLLGRNYKWWYFAKYQFKASSGQFQSFIINTTIRSVEFLAIVYIWKVNNSVAEIITYLAIGRIFGGLLFTEIDGQIASMITRGGITKIQLLPLDFFKYFVADDLGYNFIRSFVNSIITFILAMIIFRQDIILSFNILYLRTRPKSFQV